MEIVALILALIFWWTFWNRLNRIMRAVEASADHLKALRNQVAGGGPPSASAAPSRGDDSEVRALVAALSKNK